MAFSFTTATQVPLVAIARLINLVYPDDGDTPEGYAASLAAGNVDLAHSVVALDEEGTAAGIAMLGVRGARGWCGDAAVAPRYQNQGLGTELMRRLSETARQYGLRTLQLEVRENNAPARRVYEKEGYRYTRRLHCYLATLAELGWRDLPLPPAVSVQRAPDETATLARWAAPRFAVSPCWERELPSMLAYRYRAVWTSSYQGSETACLSCGWEADGKRLNLHLLGLTDDAAHADVCALCLTASRETGIETLRLGLEPMDSRVAMMFHEFGFRLDKDLWEMVKTL